MGVVLLLEPDDDDAALAARHLAARWTVRRAEAKAQAPELAGVDVVVADLDAAEANGWLRQRPARPLVLVSRMRARLASVAAEVDAVVHKPLEAALLLEAVSRALGEGSPTRRVERAVAPPGELREDFAPTARANTPEAEDKELSAILDIVTAGTGAPIGLVTMVGRDRQRFVGQRGLPIDLAHQGGTTRAWSFCRHVIDDGGPLVVSDATLDPAFADNPLVTMGLVRAYAGFPIQIEGLGTVGSVCVLSPDARTFAAADRAILQLAARAVAAHFAKHAPASIEPGGESSLAVGDLLDGKFWLTADLGEGGQSKVYLARDKLLGQLVAIKVRSREKDDGTLLAEAEALAQLRHPNIVRLQGWGHTEHGHLYVVLEYVEGRTLDDHLRELGRTGETLPLITVRSVIRQLAGALSSMHAVGYVHADLKPANVILDLALDRAVLIDFGLRLSLAASTEVEAQGGTAGFSAPEQLVAGAALPHPSLDSYALAAIAYLMLVGKEPFDRRDPFTLQLRGEHVPPSVARPGLPPALDALFARALSPDPGQRIVSTTAFATQVERLLDRAVAGSVRHSTAGTLPRSRGFAFTLYRAEGRRLLGVEAERALFERLPIDTRTVFAAVHDGAALHPAQPLVEYLRAIGDGDLARIEAFGGQVAAASLPDELQRMNVSRTPETILYLANDLMRRFHEWGTVAVVGAEANRSELTLTLPDGFAPEMCSYLSGTMRALLASGGHEPALRQTECSADGVGPCRFELTWALRTSAQPPR